MNTTQLQPYERHVALLLCAILIGLGLSAVVFRPTAQIEESEQVQIHVVGAIEETKVFVARGSTVNDVLDRIHLQKNADVAELDGGRRLVDGETIVIPYAGKKTLYVIGAVTEPRVVVLGENTGMEELIASVPFTSEADVRSFRRRKVIKNGAVVKVLAKKERKKSLGVKAKRKEG